MPRSVIHRQWHTVAEGRVQGDCLADSQPGKEQRRQRPTASFLDLLAVTEDCPAALPGVITAPPVAPHWEPTVLWETLVSS